MAESELIISRTVSNLIRYTNIPAPTDLFYTVTFNNPEQTPTSYRVTLQNIALGIKYNCLSADFAYIEPTVATLSSLSSDWNKITSENFSECATKWQTAVTTFRQFSGGWLEYNDIYPLSSIYITTASTDPGSIFPGTQWKRVGQCRTFIGAGTGNDGLHSCTFTKGTNCGASTVVLTEANMPQHTHPTKLCFKASEANKFDVPAILCAPAYAFVFDINSTSNKDSTYTVSNVCTQSTGLGCGHQNLQPYIVVNMWFRCQ